MGEPGCIEGANALQIVAKLIGDLLLPLRGPVAQLRTQRRSLPGVDA
jgi:hypothetical protein